jgi:hypothetical protein
MNRTCSIAAALTLAVALACASSPGGGTDAADSPEVAPDAAEVEEAVPDEAGPEAEEVAEPGPDAADDPASETGDAAETVAPVHGSTLARPADPVALKAGDLPLAGPAIAPGDVVAFRFDESGWVQVPVQVDERDMVEYARVYGAYAKDVNPTARDYGAGVFERFYCDDGTFTGPDSDPALDADDEIAFMAADAGARPGTFSEPAGVKAGSGIEVRVSDPLDGGGGFVYLFARDGGLDPSAGKSYVTYEFKLIGPGGAEKDYKTGYDIKGGSDHGSQRNPEDSRVTTKVYGQHWSFRWTCDELAIEAGSGVDFLEKRDYWILPGVCDRSIMTFNAGEGCFATNKSGPVRAIRSYLGANSGPLTQGTHVYYEAREDLQVDLRVHSRPSGGILYMDYNEAAFGMTYSNTNNPEGVTIDGAPDMLAGEAVTWEMVTGAPGTVVYVHRLVTDDVAVAEAVTTFYKDELDSSTEQCQACTEGCAEVEVASDPHMIGSHGPWMLASVPNTDPRKQPYNTVTVLRTQYFEGPGLTAADAEQRRRFVETPLATHAAAWTADSLPPDAVAAIDPAACALPDPPDLLGFEGSYEPVASGSILRDKAWYLLTVLAEVPWVAQAVDGDPTLSALAMSRDAAFRDAVATCGMAGGDCLAAAIEWTEGDAATAGKALASALAPTQAVASHLRLSGLFALHASLDDAALVETVVVEALSSLAAAFDDHGRARPDVGDLAAAVASAHPGPMRFFEPLLHVALASMKAAGRDEGERYEPLASGQNQAAVARMAGLDWSAWPFTVILVPGWGPTTLDQALSDAGREHCDLAVLRWRAGLAPFLLLSGGHVHPDRTPYSEAIEMKKYLMSAYGVPESAILVDPHARHTTTNLRNAAREILRYGIPADRPALVTSDIAQVPYIAFLDDRCTEELGYVPYRVVKILDGNDACWLPSPLSLHADARDPLDP